MILIAFFIYIFFFFVFQGKMENIYISTTMVLAQMRNYLFLISLSWEIPQEYVLKLPKVL